MYISMVFLPTSHALVKFNFSRSCPQTFRDPVLKLFCKPSERVWKIGEQISIPYRLPGLTSLL